MAGKKDVGKFLKNETFLKDMSNASIFGAVLNTAFGYSTYKDKREEGHGVLGAGVYAAGEMVVNEIVGIPTMIAFGATKAIPTAAVKGVSAMSTLSRDLNKVSRHAVFSNATFNDSQNAYTMRQVGMQLAKNSQYNMQQSMLGNEANYMHL